MLLRKNLSHRTKSNSVWCQNLNFLMETECLWWCQSLTWKTTKIKSLSMSKLTFSMSNSNSVILCSSNFNTSSSSNTIKDLPCNNSSPSLIMVEMKSFFKILANLWPLNNISSCFLSSNSICSSKCHRIMPKDTIKPSSNMTGVALMKITTNKIRRRRIWPLTSEIIHMISYYWLFIFICTNIIIFIIFN